MGNREIPSSQENIPHLELLVHGLELVINDKTLNEHHKKFLIYLKDMIRMDE